MGGEDEAERILTFHKEHKLLLLSFSAWATKRLLLHHGWLFRLQRHMWLFWIFHGPLWKCACNPDRGADILLRILLRITLSVLTVNE